MLMHQGISLHTEPKTLTSAPDVLSAYLPFSVRVDYNGVGFTTTSALLSWLIYFLVTHEGTQDLFFQELML